MSRELRVGVIGTGFGARVHIPGFQMHPDTTVVAVSGSSPDKARETAQRLGVPRACESEEELLALDDLDTVAIATPPFLHHDTVLRAVERGKHVLCEKPLALSAEEARRMVDAARDAGVVAAVNHEFRFTPGRAHLGLLAREGYLGALRSLHVQNVYPRRSRGTGPVPWNWWSDAERGGGVLGAIGSHYIDATRAWFGEIEGVYALLDTYVSELPDPDTGEMRRVTSDDTAMLLMRLRNGAQAVISLGSAGASRMSRVVASGEKGTLVLENDETLMGTQIGGEPEQLPTPPELQLVPVEGDRLLPPFLRLVTELVHAVRGEASGVPTLEDALRHQEVLDAARLSARERRWVSVQEVVEATAGGVA